MTDSAQWAYEHGGGARRSLPGEGTGMSGVVELAEQLAVAVKALREIGRLLDRSTQTGKAPTRDEWAALTLANETLHVLGGTE